MSHSWMSHSNYGGEDKNSRPKEKLHYGERDQNMRGDMEQSEKTEPTRTSSYNISPTGGNVNVSNDLKERVVEALHQSLRIDSTDIEIRIREDETVELCGSVPFAEMIDIAEQCVRELGVAKIDNDLKLRPV